MLTRGIKLIPLASISFSGNCVTEDLQKGKKAVSGCPQCSVMINECPYQL